MNANSVNTAVKPRSIIRRLVRLIRNVMMDMRFGGVFLGGSDGTRYAHLGAHEVANTEYDVMPYLFTPIGITESDVLVDVGCGKGRVINWWLRQGLKNKIIGVEIDPEVALKTKRRLKRYKNVEIITGDVLDLLPLEGTIYYLFNPFTESVLRSFKDSLAKHATKSSTKSIKVIYYNPYAPDPVYAEIFRDDPRWTMQPIHYPQFPGLTRDYALLIELIRPGQALETANTQL